MAAEKDDRQGISKILKNKSLRQARTTFKDAPLQFTNANSAMDMRVAECPTELKQRENRAHSFGLGQFAQSLLYGRA